MSLMAYVGRCPHCGHDHGRGTFGMRAESSDELSRLRAENAKQAERIESQQEYIDRLEHKRRCHSPYAKRPILYTDGVNGEQCCRDDLWAVSTEELNTQQATIAAQSAALARARDALINGLEYVKQTLVEFDSQYGRHPAVEDERRLIVEDIAEIEQALAAIDALPKAPEGEV